MDIVEWLRSPHLATKESHKAADEIERLRQCLKYEENRSNRIGTHSEGCWGWGPRHYECAVREIERLQLALHTISSVDADVIVPERMWSEMTPLDCYEEGLMNGAMAVRDAVKTEAYAVLALGEKE